MNVTITFTSVGADITGPFDLYSNTDPYPGGTPFETNVSLASFATPGYTSTNAPAGTTEVTCVATVGCGQVLVSCDSTTTTTSSSSTSTSTSTTSSTSSTTTTSTTGEPTTTTTTTTIAPGLYIKKADSSVGGDFIDIEHGGTYDGYPEPASGSGQDNAFDIYAIGIDVEITSVTIGNLTDFVEIDTSPDTLPYTISSGSPGYVTWEIGLRPSNSGEYSTTVSIVHDADNVVSPFVFTLHCTVS